MDSVRIYLIEEVMIKWQNRGAGAASVPCGSISLLLHSAVESDPVEMCRTKTNLHLHWVSDSEAQLQALNIKIFIFHFVKFLMFTWTDGFMCSSTDGGAGFIS